MDSHEGKEATTMPRSLQAVRSMGGVLLLTLGALGAADAQVIVTPTVTFSSFR